MSIQSISSDTTYDLIKSGIKASNVRAKTIANNMANVNTKDYKRFNVVFEENFKNENSSKLELKRTRPDHISSGSLENDNISIVNKFVDKSPH